jgi:hypothetical protein
LKEPSSNYYFNSIVTGLQEFHLLQIIDLFEDCSKKIKKLRNEINKNLFEYEQMCFSFDQASIADSDAAFAMENFDQKKQK